MGSGVVERLVEASAGIGQAGRIGVQVDLRGAERDVSHAGGQPGQHGLDIAAGLHRAAQHGGGEAVAQVMQADRPAAGPQGGGRR